MKGDFSDWPVGRAAKFAAVLFQQGRVGLDSDYNEASVIMLRHLRRLSRDIFGMAGGPVDSNGFSLKLNRQTEGAQLAFGDGHYYVDGILCECPPNCDYDNQPFYRPAATDSFRKWLQKPSVNHCFVVYLDVWDRHVSWAEDESLLEPALGGADTTSRVQVVWQVKAIQTALAFDESDRCVCASVLGSIPESSGLMAVRLSAGVPGSLLGPPGYVGTENRLYRFEIHRGGGGDAATFKWSRSNGSIVARWLGTEANVLRLTPNARITRGGWAELLHDGIELSGDVGEMVEITKAVEDRLTLAESPSVDWDPTLRNARVRVWDGAMAIRGSDLSDGGWLKIEDGLEIRFSPVGSYQSGDYWTVRCSPGDTAAEWPLDATGSPREVPPQGIKHAYAPLGVVGLNAEGGVTSCRNNACVQRPLG